MLLEEKEVSICNGSLINMFIERERSKPANIILDGKYM